MCQPLHQYRSFEQANVLLQKTFEHVRVSHPPKGHRYIRTHWTRYCNLLTRIPDCSTNTSVLEIGASLLSTLIRREWNAEVFVVHHELEPQWKPRFSTEGITSYGIDLMRDRIPVSIGLFDLILSRARGQRVHRCGAAQWGDCDSM
jgi:hypothetical protein